MFKYENQICQVCNLAFDKDDDIVVCPDCGTPHHRHCWHENGDCVNRHRHAEGYEWQPVVKEIPAGSITCTECGANMPAGTLFCENCGKPLAQPQPQQTIQDFNMPKTGHIEIHPLPPFGMGMTMGMGGNSHLTGEIDGVPLKDIAAFIGPNSQYYLFKFRRMEENKKMPVFNLAAFLFRPLWFLYRKLWKMAIFSAAMNFLTSMPMAIIYGVEAGVLASSYMFPGIQTLSTVGFVINMVLNVIFSAVAIPMYKKDTINRLKKIKAESGTDTNLYYTKLLAQCGPSKIGAVVVFFFSVYYIFAMFF